VLESCQHARIARLARYMPGADRLTPALTAAILSRRGLLDRRPAAGRTYVGFGEGDGEGGDAAGETVATAVHRAAVAAQGLANWEPEGVATAACNARDVDEGRVAMTSDDFREKCIEMINRILAQGFERPIYFAAIAIDGLTTIGSSETVIGAIQPLVKTAASGPLAMYLLPIHCLFVDPQGKVAHGVIDGSGAVSCRVLP
jgi:hypothetical protein